MPTPASLPASWPVSAPRLPHRSGDGFVVLRDGSRRWGRFGAAGVLVRYVDAEQTPWYFVARRSEHCHRGGTWAVPGGALDEGETPLEGALREFAEEIGVDLPELDVVAVHEDGHGGWSYWTHLVDIPERFDPPVTYNWETADARWVRGDELADLDLFAELRRTLVHLAVLGNGQRVGQERPPTR